jgi:hypothetical protein
MTKANSTQADHSSKDTNNDNLMEFEEASEVFAEGIL